MAWMMVPAGMPAAIIGSMTCSRMNASERPVLKMTGIPAAASATMSAMISGCTSRVTGLATGPSTSSRRASGGADGEAAAGFSGAVMAPFCQPGRHGAECCLAAIAGCQWSLFGYNLERRWVIRSLGRPSSLGLQGDIQSCGRGTPLPRPWLQHAQGLGRAAAASGPARRAGDHQAHPGPRGPPGRGLHVLRRPFSRTLCSTGVPCTWRTGCTAPSGPHCTSAPPSTPACW